MNELKEKLKALKPRDRDFAEAYALFQLANPDATDADFAEHLGVNRVTIIARRNRLRAHGIPMPSFRPRGCQRHRNEPVCKCPTCGQRVRTRQGRANA